MKRKLQVNDMTEIPFHKCYNSAVVEARGYENTTFVERDCRNYVEEARYSKFFFRMDLDDESRLKNVFWADNRCRHAYKEFDDVVTFDTTYLTNKMWLEYMHGEAPSGIINDQDWEMQNAIEIVFPTTKHRWHAIAILIRNNITTMPDSYILRRWRRNVNRAHSRVAINYDGLASTPEQMRYDDMCRAFSEVVDLTAAIVDIDGEGGAHIDDDDDREYRKIGLGKIFLA
ncbi:protein FAR-RED IMPAIRED RESPONSE 1-like [Olea europaea var. sylvestris]|uniref:protein FAR-RED IMPAIRED RESPONSE 1-like n=1 Tax=Olea europaea var. sylvestris TaxID=158386 RepID=UPI000C1D02BF|nr:protein FAR-RED IMPAIRED RESPONSE 1-like [Olea europaea var. sylvestris]